VIRVANRSDVLAIVRMGLRFAGGEYAPWIEATPEALASFAERLIGSDDATIFLAESDGAVMGMLAVMVYPHPMSGARVASELCWWIEPEARGGRTALRLVRAAEQWAVDHDARVLQMIAPTARVGEFYEALGYGRVETTYQRRVA